MIVDIDVRCEESDKSYKLVYHRIAIAMRRLPVLDYMDMSRRQRLNIAHKADHARSQQLPGTCQEPGLPYMNGLEM